MLNLRVMRKAGIIVTIIFTLLVSIDLLYVESSTMLYTPNHQYKGPEFWNGKSVYTTSESDLKIPYQLPGPLDAWSGGSRKSIKISAPYKRDTLLKLYFQDSHASYPPLLKIFINDVSLGKLQIPKGQGRKPHEWRLKGSPSQLKILIPSDYLIAENSVIKVTSIQGSWAVIDHFEIKIVSPTWERRAALILWVIFSIYLIIFAVKNLEKSVYYFKKYVPATAFLIFSVSLAGGSFYAHQLIASGEASQIMLHEKNGYFIFRSVTKAVLNRMPPGYSEDTALNALRDYVYLTSQPAGDNLGMGALNLMMHGVAWCDQSAWIYLYLVSPLKVNAYIAYLYDANGRSPHTVCYLTPRKQDSGSDAPYLQANARVVDTYNGISFKTENGGYATPDQICKNSFIANRASPLSYLFCQKQIIHASNKYVISEPAGKNWFYQKIFPLLPESVSIAYVKLAILLDPAKKPDEKEYLYARIDNLFFQFEKARKGYQDFEKKFPDSRWAKLAKHYLIRINSLAKCFGKNGYTGILPKEQAWSSVAYPEGKR